MKLTKLVRRSLTYYWRANLAVALGAAVAVAVLVGSLLVGDSVDASLHRLATERLGRVDYAVAGRRFFTRGLAVRMMARDDVSEWCRSIVPAAAMEGMAEHAGSDAVVPRATIFGVTPDFWALSDEVEPPGLQGRQVILNEHAAEDLGAQEGDAVLVRLVRQGEAPVDTVFGRRAPGETVHSLRLEVADVVPAAGLGAFSLRSGEPRPRNVYMRLKWLTEGLERPDGANLLLVDAEQGRETGAGDRLQDALQGGMRMADYGLRLEAEETGYICLESRRMVLPPEAVSAAQAAAGEDMRAAVTSIYLANSLSTPSADEPVPYSVVAGLDPREEPPLGPLRMADGGEPPALGQDDILLNSWAADRLSASPGQTVSVTYYVHGEDGALQTRTREFTLRGIVSMEGTAVDRGLVPEYEGVTDARTMADWDPPFPIDFGLIGSDDEAYWEEYRTAPKAFISLGAARSMWQSGGRGAGWVTSVRVTPGGRALDGARKGFAARLLEHVSPGDVGVEVIAAREQALRSAEGSTDYATLFLSMSMFIIAAAAGLVGLLFRLGVQRRASQFGIMLATGVSSRKARRALLAEALVIMFAGAALGVPLGVGYAGFIIYSLQTWWAGAIAGFPLALHVSAAGIAAGCVAGIAVGMAAAWWAVRALSRETALELMTGWRALAARASPSGRTWTFGASGLLLAAAAVLVLLGGVFDAISDTAAFFGGGSALLLGLLALVPGLLQNDGGGRRRAVSLPRLAWRGAAQNWLRSTLTAGLLACAAFIIVTVAANRRDPTLLNTRDRQSGAGGYDLLARTSLPIHYDPGTPQGREELNLPEDVLEGAEIVSLALSEGDDVSCLNLQRPQRPRVLGVPPEMVQRGGFRFQSTRGGEDRENPWKLLHESTAGGRSDIPVIPAVADANSARWILKKSLGDAIEVPGRNGQPVKLRLVGLLSRSIFQGELLIARDRFERHLRGSPGRQYFLVRSPEGRQEAVAEALRKGLREMGVTVTPTADLLARYAQVQNTYLATFRTLGGLGLFLGTFGVVAVLLRNVVERRRQLALMLALGFPRRRLVGMLVLENGLLLVGGMAIGAVSALVAVAPHLGSTVAAVRWGELALTLGACLAVGVTCCLVGAAASVRSELLGALRTE